MVGIFGDGQGARSSRQEVQVIDVIAWSGDDTTTATVKVSPTETFFVGGEKRSDAANAGSGAASKMDAASNFLIFLSYLI